MALHSGRFWPVSAALVAKAMGATIAGVCSRGSSFTTASAQRSAAEYSTICTAVKDCIRDGVSATAMDATDRTTLGIRGIARRTRWAPHQERRIDALLRAQPVLASQATAEEVRAWCRSALIWLIDSGVDEHEASFAIKLARRKRKASILHGWNDDGARATKDRPGREFVNRPASSGRISSTSSTASGYRLTSSASTSSTDATLDQEAYAHASVSAGSCGSGVGTTLHHTAPEVGEDRPTALTSAEPEAVNRVCMTWSGDCRGALIPETNAASMGAGAGAGATLRDPRQGRIGIPRQLTRPEPRSNVRV